MVSETASFKTGKISSSSSSTPFFIVPAAPPAANTAAKSSGRAVSFAKPAVTAPKPAPVIVDPASLVSYKAPAHKHAHHLHSIPPREKTAKTLILDHMLWQHTRARFHQARSELGLPPSPPAQHDLQQAINIDIISSTYTQQHSDLSPSTSESGGVDHEDGEDADVDTEDRPSRNERSQPLSELEEDIRALKFGVRGIDRIKAYFEHHARDRYAESVDLETALVQRATAEGMEKVLSSLLGQTFAATSHNGDGHAVHTHTHDGATNKSCLCHNVRVRIALSALVNDFFARDHDVIGSHGHASEDYSDSEDESEYEESGRFQYDQPQQQMSASRIQSPMSISSLVTSRSSRHPSPPISTISNPSHAASTSARSFSGANGNSLEPSLPPALQLLLPVSSYARPTKALTSTGLSSDVATSARAGSRSPTEPRRSLAPPNSIFSAVPRGAGPDSPWALGPGTGMGWTARVPVPHSTLPSSSFDNGASTSSWSSQGSSGNMQMQTSQAPRVWKAIGRSRELFNGGVTRARSRSQAGSDIVKRESDDGSSFGANKEGRSGTAVGREACPRHLRETDACPRTCVHKTYPAGQAQSRSATTTTIGAGLSPAGLPLRRPPPPPAPKRGRSMSFASSSSRSRSHSRSATEMSSPSMFSSGRTASSSTIGSGTSRRPSLSKPKHTEKTQPAAELGNSEARMADILPRFLRFSAFIAKELGREARETGEQRVVDVPPTPPSPRTTMSSGFASQSTSQARPHHMSGSGSSSQEPPPIHLQPSSTGDARPTRAWYALLCGIVTRAVLEGYIRAKWKGADPLEVLFGLGLIPFPLGAKMNESEKMDLGKKAYGGAAQRPDVEMRDELWSENENENEDLDESSASSSSNEEDDEYSPSSATAEFDPDDMPSVEEAVRILFGRGVLPPNGAPERRTFANKHRSLMPPPNELRGFITPGGHTPWSRGYKRPGVGETDPDWEWETSERISEFATISLNSPDLLSHLQELSRRYPPEPVERAALRFFESVTDWRGIPELEAYKARRAAATAPATDVRVKVEDNTGSAPNSPSPATAPSLPSILGYFTIPKEFHRPMPPTPSAYGANKKRGVDDVSSTDSTRSTKSARSEAAILQDEVEPGWTGPYGL